MSSISARLLSETERRLDHVRQSQQALELSHALPALMTRAKILAASALHGLHGRRRAGTGENFWQFRPLSPGESAQRIDWRRSARDEKLYVREREWEASLDVWLWIDRSSSMAFASNLAQTSKIERAFLLGLALADLLVRGGERVALYGFGPPRASRNIIEHIAQNLLASLSLPQATADLPHGPALAARARALLIGDWLSDAPQIETMLAQIAAQGAKGHLLAIVDPLEQTFPLSGAIELHDTDSPQRLYLPNAAQWQKRYLDRLAAHRQEIRRATARYGWSFSLHRTDRPASEAIMGLLDAFAGER